MSKRRLKYVPLNVDNVQQHLQKRSEVDTTNDRIIKEEVRDIQLKFGTDYKKSSKVEIKFENVKNENNDNKNDLNTNKSKKNSEQQNKKTLKPKKEAKQEKTESDLLKFRVKIGEIVTEQNNDISKLNKKKKNFNNESKDSLEQKLLGSDKLEEILSNSKQRNVQLESNEMKYFTKHKFSNQNNNESYKDRSRDNYSTNDSHKLNKSNNKMKGVCEQGDDRFIEEINEDIFQLPKEISLAHCVAEDLQMGAGIAVDFKRIFGGVGKLVDQNLKIGDVGIVNRHGQNAFYLVTKKFSNGKPTMITMKTALCSLLLKMKVLKLTKLGIPRIGCGLDGLDWSNVKLLIMEIFGESGIHITVCVPSKLIDRQTSPLLKVYFTPKNLWEMEKLTDIIIFIDLEQIHENNWINNVIDKINNKYPFKNRLYEEIKKIQLNPGDIIYYIINGETIIFAFVKSSEYYTSLEKAFVKINHSFKKYKYLAIQSDSMKCSENFQRIAWTVLIARSIIKKSELWLCGDTEQTEKLSYDQYCKNLKNFMNSSSRYSSSNLLDNNNSQKERNSKIEKHSSLQKGYDNESLSLNSYDKTTKDINSLSK